MGINNLIETIHWMTIEAIKVDRWDDFNATLKKYNTCKPYLQQGKLYDECMFEKWNCAYENEVAPYK